MNKKHLLLLISITAVVILLAVVVQWRDISRHQEKQSLLLDGLKQQLDQVTRIDIMTAGNQLTVQLINKKGQWVIAERHEYPVEFKSVRDLLTGLAEAQLVEPKTKDPQHYASLGLEDMSVAGVDTVEVSVYVKEDHPYTVLLGKNVSSGTGQYVRKPAEAQSWLMDKAIVVNTGPADWLPKQILDTKEERIQAMKHVSAKNDILIVSRKDKGSHFTVTEKLPKGKTLKYQEITNSLATVLSPMNMTDVEAYQASAFPKDATALAEFHCFDGLVITVEAVKQANNYLAHFTASYAGSATESDAKKSAAVKAEAEKLQAALSSWTYHITLYQYEALTKQLPDLTQ